jgi:hypothetical protein
MYLSENIERYGFLFWFIAHSKTSVILSESISNIITIEILMDKEIIEYNNFDGIISIKLHKQYYLYLENYLRGNRNDGLINGLKSCSFIEAVKNYSFF